MKSIVRENILKVKPYTPGKPIEEVERELGLKDVIKIASNEHFEGPSPKALKAVRNSLSKINRYPDASAFYLKRKVAGFLGVKESNLVFGNGSDEVICLALRAFVGESDEVIIARPTFLIYEIASQVQNAAIKFVPLRKDLRYDLNAMKKAITPKTKMIFIANPDNPTGTYVTKKELEGFLKGLPCGIIVFLDEAYYEFAAYGRKDYPNGIDYIGNNVIAARSFSKAYGLAGLRIGYGVADPEIISYMERVREPFNVNILAQAAAIAAVDDRAFLKKTLAHVNSEKKLMYGALDRMGLEYVPSATNFILVNVKRDCRAVYIDMLKVGVIVRDMKAWGLDNFIRVTVGTKIENRRFLEALNGVMAKSEKRKA